MIKCSRMFVGFGLLSSMVACGSAGHDGHGPSDGRFRSSVVQSKLLSALPAEDAASYCKELADWESKRLTAALPELCASGGFWAAQFANTTYPPLPLSDIQAACTSAYDACMQTDVVPPLIDCAGAPADEQLPAPNEPFSSTCQATIADAEACHNELFEAYIAASSGAPECAAIDGSVLAAHPLTITSDEPGTLGPACQNLFAKCPESSI